MANDYRNERPHRTTGGDWREDEGYSQRSEYNQGNYGNYRDNYGNGYGYQAQSGYGEQIPDDRSYDYGQNRDRRRNRNDMDGDQYGDYYGSRSYSRASYRPDYNRGMNDYDRRGYRNEYSGYHRGVGYNSPNYGREHIHRDNEFYDDNRRDFWDRATDEMASWFGDEGAERRRRMDKIEGHRGKGPKGYKRSDDRIREDINDRLSDDPWVDASDIEVSVNNSEVTVTGNVRDRNDKRRVEDIIERVSGVSHVENRVRVAQTQTTVGSDYRYPTATTTGGATDTNSKADNGKSKSSKLSQ